MPGFSVESTGYSKRPPKISLRARNTDEPMVEIHGGAWQLHLTIEEASDLGHRLLDMVDEALEEPQGHPRN